MKVVAFRDAETCKDKNQLYNPDEKMINLPDQSGIK
jgi:hypothetical protein